MSIPVDYTSALLKSLSQDRLNNLIAQADARRILQEVKESPENYPAFDPLLTEKVTHIAYALLSCGCSLIEGADDSADEAENLGILERAGKLLSDAYRYNDSETDEKNYNLLIAGMALYAAKQYSRAFIVLKDINLDFSVGQLIIQFVKKDFNSLLKSTSKVFFEDFCELSDIHVLDEWVISHEIARIFMIITDYVQTGNKDDFTIIDDIFNKLLLVAVDSNLISFWLIIRLLRIILSTYFKASLWSVLPPLLSSQYTTKNYIQLLSGFVPPVTELWPSQVAAIPLAVGENDGGIINLRTSGGKTRVAEIAIINTLSSNGMSKVLYLAPFRSLAFEVEQSLSKVFNPLGITVSQLYGGSTANLTDFELINESQVVIATPEKAKALIRCGSGLETKIKLIVVDEGHLLGAEERYIKNEMFLTHIKEFASRNQIRMLLLSAVLPNANELAEWIAADSNLVAKSEWKPSLERLGLLLWDGTRVRLQWKSDGDPFNPNFVQKAPLGFGRRRNPFPNDKKEAIAATAVRLAQTGTVMIYSAKANAINGLAESVLLALGEHPNDFDWDESLWNVFESVCKEELGDSDIVLTAAQKGVICHNNRLPALVRIAIERLMRSKAPLIIIASSTLGQGVNIGISTVIVSTPYFSNETISNRDFWNICGRAGRAFSDVEGKILYAIDTKASNDKERWRVRKDMNLADYYFNNQQMEKVQSGLFIALRQIYKCAEETGTDFSLLLEAIANDSISANIHGEFAKWLNTLFDFLDDELLAMHEDFNSDGTDLDWVEPVFRKSLALIQAEAEHKEDYINLLRARTKALLNRIPNRAARKKLIASGIPLTVSMAILDDIDKFKSLALSFILSTDAEDQIEQTNNIVREIEIWSNANAANLMEFVPSQTILDNFRHCWISGMPLSEIIKSEPNAAKISKDYYGYTLPWIIHAISQMFDSESEQIFIQAYSSIAMFVELGLPNVTSSNIYLAGVRSRGAALELSNFDVFQNKSISEVKRILSSFQLQDCEISETTKAWIKLLSDSANSQKPKEVSFPAFTWKRNGLPDKLYLRETNGDCFLISEDGYFYEKVESTSELPFLEIANIQGLYFKRDDDIWNLRSNNPKITVR